MSGLLGPSGSSGGHGPLWSVSDDYFLIDNPLLTAKQIGETLGRSPSAVSQRKAKLKAIIEAEGVPQFGKSNKNPHCIGKRTVVAASCKECGLLLDGSWFYRNGQVAFNQICRRCRPIRYGREKFVGGSQRELQRLSKKFATKTHQRFLQEDLRVLGDDNLSILQMALKLSRTYASVSSARQAYCFSNEVRLGDPADVQWYITFKEEDNE